MIQLIALMLMWGMAMASPLAYGHSGLMPRSQPAINEVLAYIEAAQRQHQRQEPSYGYQEAAPVYSQRGYMDSRPRRVMDNNMGPLIQYLNSPEFQQDYPSYADQVYSDADGDWYDEASPDYGLTNSEQTNQDMALAKLMLDHMAGKYSLEDLETLQREAKIEETTENQLRSIAKQAQLKKANRGPLMGMAAPRSISRSHMGLSRDQTPRGLSLGVAPIKNDRYMGLTSQNMGQKEVALMIPATSARRPVFVQQMEEEKKRSSKQESSSTSTVSPIVSSKHTKESSQPKGRESGVVEVVKVKSTKQTPASVEEAGDSPYLRPAYEALKKYLETERRARVTADEEVLKSPQKRFVKPESPTLRESHRDALSDQLNNLKKSVA